MNYKEGNKVVCINSDRYKKLILNKQYTIDIIYAGGIFFDACVSLTEFGDEKFRAYRFELDTTYYRKQKLKQLRNGI
jgi:hypothetical protein